MLVEVTLVLTCLAALHYFLQKTRTQIPGPKGWPLVGNAFQVEMYKPYRTTAKWAKEFGPVFQMSMFTARIVVVTGTKALREMLTEKGEDFANRPSTFRLDMVTHDKNDVAFGNHTDKFKFMKKQMFAGLKQHNLKHIENITLAVVREFIHKMKNTKEEAFDPYDYLRDSMLEIIHVMIFNTIPNADVKQAICKMIDLGNSANELIGDGNLLDAFPFVRHLGNRAYNKLCGQNSMSESLHKTWKNGIQNDEIKDCWFKTIYDLQKTSVLSERNVRGLTDDFFGAGLLTSAESLYTFLNVLTHYPRVQESLQAEVDKVVGSQNEISLDNRELMPFTRACILELLRFHSVAPFAVPHITTQSTSIQGIAIPKGAQILPNLWAHHHDPNIWPEPFEFNPNRFLKQNGELVLPGEFPRSELFAFGRGPRSCPGETLALTRIFLFIANIAQKFTVLPAATIEEQQTVHPEMGFTLGVTAGPKPYKVRMMLR